VYAIVIDPAGGIDIDNTGDEDDGPGEPVAELGDDDEDDEEDDDELELETSTPNSTTGKVSVWPRVAFGLLLQAAFIVSRTMTSAWLESPQEHTGLSPLNARSLTVPKHNRPRLSTQARSTGICVCGKGSAVYIAVIILRSHGRSKPRGFKNRPQGVARCIARRHTGGGGCVGEKAGLDSIFHID
jgi:hypothetical protein